MQPTTNNDLPAEIADVLETGMVLGQNHTFALVAGRCSAAQAESLLRLRESKCYLRLAKTWKEFCPQFLKMSSSQVDRLIHCWQEFGPAFFELQKLISISPTVYRSIEPAMKDGAIHLNDEAIALEPGNSQKVAAAVAELRRSLPAKEPPPAPTVEDRISDVERRSEALIAELERIRDTQCQGSNKDWFEVVVQRTSKALNRMKLELGVF
jgi:hypothetical protein